MPEVVAVDCLEVLVLVDNATDSLSTNPANVTAEWSGLLAAGRLPVLSGQSICRAHHGLSLLLTAHVGGSTRTVLFDAGPEGATFVRNAGILGVNLGQVEAVVLSHGHWDHAGGLLAAIDGIAKSRAGTPVHCYVHPGMFGRRGSRRPNGELYEYEPVPEPEALSKAGAVVVNTREPQLLAGGAFYVSTLGLNTLIQVSLTPGLPPVALTVNAFW
jgi:7,8-dihydropterin-6-yl-methyl-4-(beta-D-ribofuranosyl)aminobenzene 5'-phosphate synthase